MMPEAKALKLTNYTMPFTAVAKMGIEYSSDGPLRIKAIVLEEGLNSHNWAIPLEEFEGIAEQYRAGRQLRLNHGDNVQDVIGRSKDAMVLKGSQVKEYLGREIEGIDPNGNFIGVEFEAEPADNQVRTNILNGYVTAGSIGVEGDLHCAECEEPLMGGEEPNTWTRLCDHDEAGVNIRNVKAPEYSYVAEGAYEHTKAFPSFAAGMDKTLNIDSSLTSEKGIKESMVDMKAARLAAAKLLAEEHETEPVTAEQDIQEDKLAFGAAMVDQYKKGVEEERARARAEMDEEIKQKEAKSKSKAELHDKEEEAEEHEPKTEGRAMEHDQEDAVEHEEKVDGRAVEHEDKPPVARGELHEEKPVEGRAGATDQQGLVNPRVASSPAIDIVRIAYQPSSIEPEPWIKEMFEGAAKSPTAPNDLKGRVN